MGCAFAGGNDAVKTLAEGVEESLLQTSENPHPGASGCNEIAQRAGNMVIRGKRPAARIKTPGAFLNNATRWPGYGRTSGMMCVIARAGHAMDGGFCVFPI